jgi:type IV pilus assembly protein PilC
MYAEAGVPLPGSTRLVLAAAELILTRGHRVVIAASLLACTALWGQRRFAVVAEAIDRCVLALPAVGRAVHAGQRSRIYGLLEALIGAGLNVDEALSLTVPTVPNRTLRAGCERVRVLVRNGTPLSGALARSGVDADGGDAALLKVAEATGDYTAAFRQLRAIAEEQQNAWAAAIFATAEPAAVAVMAAVVGTAVVAVYQPVLGSAALLARGIQ